MGMTRAEHVRWCKDRAWQEYRFYQKDGEEVARRNAIASMCSDLGKHEATRGLGKMAFMIAMTVVDYLTLKKFIDGFTE